MEIKYFLQEIYFLLHPNCTQLRISLPNIWQFSLVSNLGNQITTMPTTPYQPSITEVSHLPTPDYAVGCYYSGSPTARCFLIFGLFFAFGKVGLC
jgi:hypothetical protein